MAIDAMVTFVELAEDGSGVLNLAEPRHGAIPGQVRLRFSTSPHEVTALNGLPVWGGASTLMLGATKIADRIGYTRISFIEREPFLAAVAQWHAKERTR